MGLVQKEVDHTDLLYPVQAELIRDRKRDPSSAKHHHTLALYGDAEQLQRLHQPPSVGIIGDQPAFPNKDGIGRSAFQRRIIRFVDEFEQLLLIGHRDIKSVQMRPAKIHLPLQLLRFNVEKRKINLHSNVPGVYLIDRRGNRIVDVPGNQPAAILLHFASLSFVRPPVSAFTQRMAFPVFLIHAIHPLQVVQQRSRFIPPPVRISRA